ncbi:NAD(P)/FAD-dependent oxidoreductase [Oculatella sp. LEGE 06141]|uniref:dihydrolipoyl dehydrogenase family protein n=1 Tax=Oculatella sp. LEGE 06141 TaxID=1828648 RepID=UPI00187E7D64|nr:NAD(P)/FAD-dependent oxidoreductase [Oculatella sp. LEGE 06141]MBE9180664.1 NAD(P)/FAD-dependent oxidoreductase [Oculatella sp. LEGE 06141]
MAVDYDLVILGGSAIARYAAAKAVQFKARVALVEPDPEMVSALDTDAFYAHSVNQMGRMAQHLRRANERGIQWDGVDPSQSSLSMQWPQGQTWTQLAAEVQAEARSLPLLAAQGVDVVLGQGEFSPRPSLTVEANGRSLHARSYLIATGSRPAIPAIEGLAAVNYLTLASLSTANWQTLPEKLIIIGAEPAGVELAQAFARLGSQVTLIINHSQLLPCEDAEAAYLIQAQLEAEGIRVLTQTAVIQTKRLGHKTWVQAGNQALEADAIVLATGHRPWVESLNLEGVGVKWHRRGIQVNRQLQTVHPRIYACGAVLGGYGFPQLARHEVDVALRNALFLPTRSVNYATVPWAVLTDPELARVGLTEAQARRNYGDEIMVLRYPFKALAKAQLRDETTGLCKLIVKPTGEILGAHLVGGDMSEFIGTIALAMQHTLSMDAIANLQTVSPSFSEVLSHAAADWQQQRRDRHPFWRDCLENWFNLRRSWSRK